MLVTKASKSTNLRAKSCINWDGINKDLEEMVKRCPTCQELRKSNAKETLMPQEVPTRAWQILGTDLFHFNDNECLIIADYYSKYPFVRKIPKPCTSHAFVSVTKGLLSEQGVPEKIISDNGRHFDCVNYRSFAETWGFDHIISSPHYPQSNGFIERCIQTVKNTLTKARESQMDPDMAMLCLRTTPIDHSLPSPSELLCAWKLKANLPVNIRNPLNSRDEIQSRLQERQDVQKSYHDRHAHDLPPLMIGQPIRMQDHTSGRWNQAIVNARCYEPCSYMVEAQNGHILRRNRRQIQETSPARRRVRFANDPAGEMQTLRTQTAEEASSPQQRGERQQTTRADVRV